MYINISNVQSPHLHQDWTVLVILSSWSIVFILCTCQRDFMVCNSLLTGNLKWYSHSYSGVNGAQVNGLSPFLILLHQVSVSTAIYKEIPVTRRCRVLC